VPRALILLSLASSVVLAVGAFFFSILFWPWGLLVTVLVGAVLTARALLIIRRARRRFANQKADPA
jgi:hypothetical protein